jgi:hypothetical protein
MDNLEYEFSGQELSRSRENDFVIEIKPNQEQRQDLMVEFSVNIVKALEEKVSSYNSNRSKRVTLHQLKKVFCESLDSYSSTGEFTNTAWAFAKVNLYLRVLSGEHVENLNFINTYKKPNLIEISTEWIPSEVDIQEAQSSIKDKGLDLKFESADELYINFQPIEWEID